MTDWKNDKITRFTWNPFKWFSLTDLRRTKKQKENNNLLLELGDGMYCGLSWTLLTSGLQLISQFWSPFLKVDFKGFQAASIALELFEVRLQFHLFHSLSHQTVLATRRQKTINYIYRKQLNRSTWSENTKDRKWCRNILKLISLASIVINVNTSSHFKKRNH